MQINVPPTSIGTVIAFIILVLAVVFLVAGLAITPTLLLILIAGCALSRLL